MPGKYTEPSNPARICTDCLQWEANGETDPDWTPEQVQEFHDRRAAQIGDAEVTLGMLAEYHSCSATQEIADDCECEDLGFSWSPCDTCGSNLGGDRHAATFWYQPEAQAEA